jgi:hypothetical protein
MNSLSDITLTTEALSINICGTPCAGDCQTCVKSAEELEAFYNPAPAPAPAEESVAISIEDAMEVARTLDAVDDARRTGEYADQDVEEDEYNGDCDCRECRLGYVPENWFDDRQDDYYDDRECGMDWNESGYFD